MTVMQTRDKSVDFAKSIAMIAISFGYIMPILYGTVEVVCKYFYSFELAGFFIMSGYLQYGNMRRKPKITSNTMLFFCYTHMPCLQ